MSITVERAGPELSIQDWGRLGQRQWGISPGGAVDRFALRIANLLVGNDEAAPALEMTLIGPVLRLEQDLCLAVHGAPMALTVEGVPLPRGRPCWLPRGTQLRCGPATVGCRAYLAVAGGFAAPSVLGGRGYSALGQVGGTHGRFLRSGDRLTVDASQPAPVPANWSVRLGEPPEEFGPWPIRVVPGPQADWFAAAERQRFLEATYIVTSESNRAGCRLAGPPVLPARATELASEPVDVGAIQVPAGGAPLILLGDGPATGGYPKIAHIITADLPTIAQARPGQALRFVEVDWETARRLRERQQTELARVRFALRWWWERLPVDLRSQSTEFPK